MWYESGSDAPEPTFVPVLGRIAAGGPIAEAVEDVFRCHVSWLAGHLFLRPVTRWCEAAICDGDWVVVTAERRRRKRRSLAMIDGVATVKTFKRRRSGVVDRTTQPSIPSRAATDGAGARSSR